MWLCAWNCATVLLGLLLLPEMRGRVVLGVLGELLRGGRRLGRRIGGRILSSAGLETFGRLLLSVIITTFSVKR